MISFELAEDDRFDVPWDEKTFDYWVESLKEEGFDEDVAESAVNKALEIHLKEGTIDDYEECLDDVFWWAEEMQNDKDGTTSRTRGLEL